MKKYLPVILLGLVVFASGCLGQTELSAGGSDAATEATVDVSSSGFSPSTVTIERGGSVTWINRMSDPVWVASAVHPRHTAYSGGAAYGDGDSYQGSLGCIAQGQPKEGAFDSCKGLRQGEAFTFTFNEAGEWNYHNHLSPGMTGTVVVVE